MATKKTTKRNVAAKAAAKALAAVALNERTMERLAGKAAPHPAVVNAALNNERDEYGRLRKIDGLPQFLRDAALKHPPMSDEQLTAMLDQQTGKKRDWVAIRKEGEWTVRPTMPVRAADESLPVSVQIKNTKVAGSTFLARYTDMADFRANHDFKTYPTFGQPSEMNGITIILVSAKPWAGKERPKSDKPKRAPGTLGEKAQKIADLLMRPEGTTTKEVLEATGWPAVSMPAQAKIAGLTLRKEKVDGVTRYWGSK